jgi:hypothetical protein
MTESLAECEHGRLGEFRRELPGAVARITEFVVDNPGQVALIAAGTVVLAAAARNIARPKTITEVIALQVLLTAAMPLIAGQVVQRGWLTVRVRDASGALVTTGKE